MLTNAGRDHFHQSGLDTTGFTGTSGSAGNAPTATTLTDSGSPAWTTDQWKGHVVITGAVYGVIASNTSSVLTVDKWYQPASPGGSAASTPAGAISYVIVPGAQPAFWIALTTDSGAPALGDTTLASELSGSGLSRKVAAFTHSAGATTSTLTATWTSSDGTARIINKIGVFNASANGRIVFETLVSNAPTLVSGDQLTVTDTITIS